MVKDLRILTARPTQEQERLAPHALYGVLNANEPTSAALWLTRVVPAIEAAWQAQQLPLLVGGTGMYVDALRYALALVPPIDPSVREYWRQRSLHQPSAALHRELTACDPLMAQTLKPGDTQRIVRALEVFHATGRSLLDWQHQPTTPALPQAQWHCFTRLPPRDVLYHAIDRRFEEMLAHGAMKEVIALLQHPCASIRADQPLQHQLMLHPPIFRAHGVPELIAWHFGQLSEPEAIRKGQQHTRNYAKRQITWLRHQMSEAQPVENATPLLDTIEKLNYF